MKLTPEVVDLQKNCSLPEALFLLESAKFLNCMRILPDKLQQNSWLMLLTSILSFSFPELKFGFA